MEENIDADKPEPITELNYEVEESKNERVSQTRKVVEFKVTIPLERKSISYRDYCSSSAED